MREDGVPRLAIDKVDTTVRDRLGATVERLGYFGEFFQVAAHLPEGLLAFMDYTQAVKAPLPLALSEVCALTVCSLEGGDYERIQHERLALKSGFSRTWIAGLIGKNPGGLAELSEEEAAVRDLAMAVVTRRGRDVASEMKAVADLIGPQQAVAVLHQITRFQGISTFCKVFGLVLPVPSVFAEGEAE